MILHMDARFARPSCNTVTHPSWLVVNTIAGSSLCTLLHAGFSIVAFDMAEWEELDTVLSEATSSSSRKRKSRKTVTTAAPEREADCDAQPSAVAAAASSTVDPVPAFTTTPAIGVTAAPGATHVLDDKPQLKSASSRSSSSSELERLRAENAALREQLSRRPSSGAQSASAASSSRSLSPPPRLTSLSKARVSFHHVSLRARNYLEKCLQHAEVESDKEAEDGEEKEEETMEELLVEENDAGKNLFVAPHASLFTTSRPSASIVAVSARSSLRCSSRWTISCSQYQCTRDRSMSFRCQCGEGRERGRVRWTSLGCFRPASTAVRRRISSVIASFREMSRW